LSDQEPDREPLAGGVDILERQRVHEGFFELEVLTLRHLRFDGGWTRPLRREVFRIRDAVCILPYDPERDAVVLIEQFRAGVMTQPEGPWLIESVAGLTETGEPIETTAVREVREEAGLEVQRLERIGVYMPSPGAVSERSTIFIAHVDSRKAGGVHGLDGEDEDIRSHVLPAETAFTWVDEGRIVAANCVLPLRWLQLNRDDLRRRWRR